MAKPFKGRINLDVRDSVADWDAFTEQRAPEGAPNVLVVLYDDTGQAAWSPYGGRIEMPTMDRLAANGLTYSQWHTTALCSPTRSTFLTGRNHHSNGFASISESASGFPGYSSHIPPENGTLAHVLRDAGYSTFWVGKNHNTPVDAWTQGSSKKEWPLGQGYDRFYGFIGGETNNWYPDLAEDNHYIDQPYLPEDGYHLSKDLADHALRFIRDTKQSEPDKPWYLWFCPGANHAPHHAPQEFIDKYKGRFDDGYEAYREWVLPRMIERGILPEGTELTPINPMPEGTFGPGDAMPPWDTLSDEEKALFARMAEVYAGFSEYTDHQVGRIVDYLEESGQLDNTISFYCADNGASGEGSGKDGNLVYAYNFLGVPPETRVVAPAPTSGAHLVGVEFTKERVGEHHESHGPLKLYVDEEVVAEQDIRTMTGHFSLCGEGLCIGYDSGDAVSSEYGAGFSFTGGKIEKVVFDVGDDVYIDVERHLAAAMARD